MLKIELDKFYKKLHSIQKSGATRNENVISDAFKSLLEAYCDTKDLILLREKPYKNKRIRPDGTVRGALPNLDYGYWESKDIFDDIDKEIEKKIEIGYPTDNIIFENSKTIVLIQKTEANKQAEEVFRCELTQPKEIDRLLRAFIDFKPQIITDFYRAIEQFKNDVPYIVEELRNMIVEQSERNEKFKIARSGFWELCRQSIDKTISADDIREMLIQHILTDEIFSTVYNESHFHRENNIAIELQKVTDTFFTREIRYNTLAKIDYYYETIKTYAEAEIKKEAAQLNRQIQVYDQEFAQVMETHRKQTELLKNKKITVLVENENRKAVLENFFFKLPKFGKPKFVLKDNFKEFAEDKELIIFDDFADSEQSDKFYETLLKNDNRQTNRIYLWYMKRHSAVINNPAYKTFVNSANSEITLYSRLLETINYQNDFNQS